MNYVILSILTFSGDEGDFVFGVGIDNVSGLGGLELLPPTHPHGLLSLQRVLLSSSLLLALLLSMVSSDNLNSSVFFFLLFNKICIKSSGI